MADLVTRLILDNKQFNNNIAKSKQETQQFENVSTKITGTIGKFAAGIGIAMGATEAFNKVIHSSQTMGTVGTILLTHVSQRLMHFSIIKHWKLGCVQQWYFINH